MSGTATPEDTVFTNSRDTETPQWNYIVALLKGNVHFGVISRFKHVGRRGTVRG